MIVDQGLRVCNAVSVRESDPDYSSSIDLTKSPDLGSGCEIWAAVVVDTYTAGTSTATTINVVTSSVTGLSTTPRVIGTVTLTAAQLEARDDDANKQPIIIKINPDQDSGTDTTGVAERYLGLEFDHATAAPTVMTVTAYIGAGAYQSDPTHGYQDSGFTIA